MKQNRNGKRLLSLLLMLVMAIGLMPAGVMPTEVTAEETENGSESEQEETYAESDSFVSGVSSTDGLSAERSEQPEGESKRIDQTEQTTDPLQDAEQKNAENTATAEPFERNEIKEVFEQVSEGNGDSENKDTEKSEEPAIAPVSDPDLQNKELDERIDLLKTGDSSDTPVFPEYPAYKGEQTVKGITVAVTAEAGIIPNGTELCVESVEVAKEVKEAVDAVRDEDVKVAVSYTFDIKLIKDGEEVQLLEGKTVSVSFQLTEVTDQNLKTEVYHISNRENGYSAEALPVVETEENAAIETTGFSYYIVEFTYHNLEYVLNGGERIPLTEILNRLCLTGEVTAAKVSDNTLFTVTDNNGEWIVTSLQAFESEEWMKVTINGVDYEIVVTDTNETYNLWVGGVEVTSANKDDVLGNADSGATVRFTPAEGETPATLTLTDAAITNAYTDKDENEYGIYYTGTGTLRIVSAEGSINRIGSEATSFYVGVFSNDGNTDLIISGAGELIVAASGEMSTGIYANNDITIIGTTLRTTASKKDSDGIVGDNVRIENSTVSAYGEDYGIYASNTVYIEENSTVTAIGEEKAIGVYVKNAVAGTGWDDTEGTQGKTKIPVNTTDSQVLNYLKVEFSTLVEYPLWIGGEQVTSANMHNVLENDPTNDGKVSFTPAEAETPAVLTLSGVNITKPCVYGSYTYGIRYTDTQNALNIVLSPDTDNIVKSNGEAFSTAIYSRNDSVNVTISGSGRLSVSGESGGITSYGELNIRGGEVNADVNGEDSTGLKARDMTIEGDTVNVSASGIRSRGIYVIYDSDHRSGGCLTLNNGTVTASGQGYSSSGIYTGSDMMINNGTLNASAAGEVSDGIYTRGNMTIEGGVVNASCDEGTAGISAIYREGSFSGNVIFKGGYLTASGTNKAILGGIKNAVVGTGWDDVEGTQGKQEIKIFMGIGGQQSDCRKLMFPALVEYPLWIGNTQVTSINKDDVLAGHTVNTGSVSFTPAEGKIPAALKLNNASITAGYTDGNGIYGIYYDGSDALDIVLEGTSEINAVQKEALFSSGIYSSGQNNKVTISGKGTLKANGSKAPAIYLNGNLTINGGSIIISGENSDGIYTDSLNIMGGTVTAEGKEGKAITSHTGITIVNTHIIAEPKNGIIYHDKTDPEKAEWYIADVKGNSASYVVIKPASVTGVTVKPASLSLKTGETGTLTAAVIPENAANRDVKWSSSNLKVASIDSNGKVTAKAAGSADITVTTVDGKKTATCKVTVIDSGVAVKAVRLNKASLTLETGKKETLLATVIPDNATNKNVTWTSSNTNAATVSNGTVTAKAAGTAVITVKTADGNKTASCTVTVKNPVISVTGVSLNRTSLTLDKGKTGTLTAAVSPSNATNKNITWSSSNSNVASVSNGTVTAKIAGTAVITVTTADGKKTAKCTVTVNEDKVVAFVTRLYKLCLNRTPDQSGLNNWVNQLKSGQSTAADVVQGFFYSNEMNKMNLSDEEWVERCYNVMMDRKSDAGGKANWVAVLKEQMKKDVLKGFIDSNEFTRICKDYGITKGTISDPAGLEGFVARCYNKVLRRDYDPSGLKNWVNEINNGTSYGKTKKERAINVASRGFFNSQEFLARKTSNEVYVKTLYRTFLGREADPSGMNNWLGKLNSGTMNREQVLMGFAGSQEFLGILKSYGIQ